LRELRAWEGFFNMQLPPPPPAPEVDNHASLREAN
jgi:hypothetical protein